MKMTLIELVQDVLNDLDSDEVNHIDDTIEAQQVAQIIKTSYLYNLFGFPLFCDYYEGMMNKDKFWRESTAKVPQSTVGCITAIAFCKIQAYIEEKGLSHIWHLRNDKHDSLLLECPENNRDDAAPILQQAIEQELTSPRGETFKMKSEIGWGYNWMKYDKDINPQGMRELKT